MKIRLTNNHAALNRLSPVSERPADLTLQLIGLFGLFEIVATAPLWTSAGQPEQPQIPWVSLLCGVPFWFDRLALSVVVLCLLSLICWPVFRVWNSLAAGKAVQPSGLWRRYCCGLLVLCWGGLVLLDQHRLQPWAWQFLWFLAFLGLAPNKVGIRTCRWFIVSIYAFSALSKLDVAFFTGHGQLLLEGLTGGLGIEIRHWSPSVRFWLAVLFPVGELLIAVLLLMRSTILLGLWGAWGMHVLLLLTLGPWGLQHEAGVLIWNAYFILQTGILFGFAWREQRLKADTQLTQQPVSSTLAAQTTEDLNTPPEQSGAGEVVHENDHLARQHPAARLLLVLAGGICLLPLLEPFGAYDHWPGWAVYSARPERVLVFVREAELSKLPEWVQQLGGAPAPLDDRIPLSFDRWAFEHRGCPIYPQGRYRLAVARAVLQPHLPDAAFEITFSTSPNRRTGERRSTTLQTWSEVEAHLSRSWINTQPRTPQ